MTQIVCENVVLRRTFGPNKEGSEAWRKYIMKSFIICEFHLGVICNTQMGYKKFIQNVGWKT